MASQSPSNPIHDLASLSPAQQRELLTKLLQEKLQRDKQFPMSAGQQGLWHAFRRDPSATPFNVFLPTRFRTTLDVNALRKSIEWVARRHASLRTIFSDSDGKLTQTVRDDLLPEFTVEPMRGAGEDQVRAAVVAETLRPFDLERGPLLRMKLYQLADDDWIVLAITHHIIVDFWSLVLILQELRVALAHFSNPAHRAAEIPKPPPIGAGYAEFVRDQTALLQSARGQAMQQYWIDKVQQSSPVLELPLDRIRPPVFSGRAASVALQFRSAVGAQISRLATHAKVTNVAIVHAGLQVFLSRLGQQSSFYIGSPFSGRLHSKFERTVGFFVNMLPIQVEVDPRRSFVDLTQLTHNNFLESLENENFPIAEIVHAARIARDPSRSPLFQVACTFEKSHVREEAGRAGFLFPSETIQWEFGGLKQESFYIPHSTCHYDLEFVFEQTGDQLQGLMLYCRDLWEPESARCMAANFCALFENLLSAAREPLERIAWPRAAKLPTQTMPPWAKSSRASDVETKLQVAQSQTNRSNHLLSSTTNGTLCELFAVAARSVPEACALQVNGQVATYADFVQNAVRIADALRQLGVGQGEIVPVIARRGPLPFIAMLGVQWSGGAAVPIDARQPAIDWPTLAADTRCQVILADEEHVRVLSESLPSVAPKVLSIEAILKTTPLPAGNNSRSNESWTIKPPDCKSTEPAYIVYTSGSTGKPKGVIVEHAAIVNTMRWRIQAVPLTKGDRVLMLLSHQFDAGLGMAWTTWTQGATLVWPDAISQQSDSMIDPQMLIEQIQRDGITVLPAIPSLLKAMILHPNFARCSSLRYLWTGGESMPADLPALVRRVTQARLWNFYGPTEAAIEATAADVTDLPLNHTVPIGWPIAGAEVIIVDSLHRPVPPTVPGEIAIAGAGLARGYLNDAELTKKKFVPHPLTPTDSPRIYLTGDRGRQRADGQIEFLGRTDFQVKVRGYRLELGEIETQLESHPLVQRAAVKVSEANTAAASLIAFLQLAATDHGIEGRGDQYRSSAVQRIMADVREQLPPYKVPSSWIAVENMPLTSSGKVDRNRLPNDLREAQSQAQVAEQIIEPRTPLEAFLEQIWKDVLLTESIGVDRNFFDAGGSSLQAAIVTSRISSDLGVNVPTALLFDLANIAQIANRLVSNHPDTIAERFGSECALRQSELCGPPTSALEPRPAHPLIANLKTSGTAVPIFMVHPPGGIVVCYRELAGTLPPAQPLYAIRSRGLHGDEPLPATLSQMAAEYIEALRTIKPKGPYIVGGWSLGGLIAYEMAQQLTGQGEHVAKLILLDTTIPVAASALVPAEEQVNVGLEYGIELSLDELAELTAEEQLPFLWEHANRLGVLSDDVPPEVVEKALLELRGLFHHHVALSRSYRLLPLAVDVLLVRPREVPFALQVREDRGWGYLVRQVQVAYVSGHHHSMVQGPHVQELATAIQTGVDM